MMPIEIFSAACAGEVTEIAAQTAAQSANVLAFICHPP
jgi:hypothetical protein